MPYVLSLNKIDHDHKSIVGEKAWSLAKIYQQKLPVNPAFVVSSQAQIDFIKQNNLTKKINEQLKLFDLRSPETALSAVRRIKDLIQNSALPKDLVEDIFDSYEELDNKNKSPVVSLRCSLIKEQMNVPHPLFLNVKGEHTVAELLKEFYGNLLTPQLLMHSHIKELPKTAVIVQKMFNSTSSGYLHSIDPYTKNKKTYVIEAVWGLAEILKQNSISRDKYSVDKQNQRIVLRKTYPQQLQLTIEGQQIKETAIPFSQQLLPKLNDKQIFSLIKYAKKLANLSSIPQTVEWGFDGVDFSFFQTQELLESNYDEIVFTPNQTLPLPVLFEGFGDNPGMGSGLVSFSSSYDQNFAGEIVVLEEYDRQLLDLLIHVNGIINCDSDNRTDIKFFAKQYGIPLIHIDSDTQKQLKSGEYITIDGSTGMVYKGSFYDSKRRNTYEREVILEPDEPVITQISPIKTKIKVFLDLHDLNSDSVYDVDMADGVAIIRGEQLYLSLDKHPLSYLAQGKDNELQKILAAKLNALIPELNNKPVFYKISDLTGGQMQQLHFSSDYEMPEQSGILGFRGSTRHLENSKLLQLEIDTINRLKIKESNLHIVVPFVRISQELEMVGKNLKDMKSVWLYIESPANCINIPQYKPFGIKGVIVDLQKLTMMTLGVDPQNPKVSQLYNEFDSAVLWLLKRLTEYCSAHKIQVILGNFNNPLDQQRLSVLLQLGIYGLSVKPKSLLEVKKIIANLEK